MLREKTGSCVCVLTKPRNGLHVGFTDIQIKLKL